MRFRDAQLPGQSRMLDTGQRRRPCAAAVTRYQDVIGKSLGSSNPHNLSKATFTALRDMVSAETVAKNRNLSLSQLFQG